MSRCLKFYLSCILTLVSGHIRREGIISPGGGFETPSKVVDEAKPKVARISNLSKKGRKKLEELQAAVAKAPVRPTASLLESESIKLTLPDKSNATFKILLVTVVQDAEPALDNLIFNVQRIQDNVFGDTVDVALFHHDNADQHWKHNLTKVPTQVVLTGMGHLCKMQAWIKVTPEIAQNYDYVWFLDADLRLEDFSWNLYHRILTTIRPLVSQPAVLPALPGMRSTDIEELRMIDVQQTLFPIAITVSRSEIQTPLVSTKLWPMIYSRLLSNNLHSGWFIDTFWDFVASHAAKQCGTASVILVNGSPVRHFNWHDLIEGPNRCIKSSPQNNRPVTSEDFANINAFLKDYCGFTGRIESQYSSKQRHMTMTEMNDLMMKQMTENKVTLLYDTQEDIIVH